VESARSESDLPEAADTEVALDGGEPGPRLPREPLSEGGTRPRGEPEKA